MNSTISGQLFVVAAPSGAGKTSLVNALLANTENVVLSVSYTTRPQRVNEQEGVNYYFVDHAEFEQMIKDQEFLEYANVFSKVSHHYYGTRRAFVEAQLDKGLNVILEVDWQGARQIFKLFPEKSQGIFILPPSLAVLEQRLLSRGRESLPEVAARMSVARDEISHCGEYHHILINEDFEQTLAQLQSIMRGEIRPLGPGLQHFSADLQNLVRSLLAE